MMTIIPPTPPAMTPVFWDFLSVVRLFPVGGGLIKILDVVLVSVSALVSGSFVVRDKATFVSGFVD